MMLTLPRQMCVSSGAGRPFKARGHTGRKRECRNAAVRNVIHLRRRCVKALGQDEGMAGGHIAAT
jgi:hypothetical protein